MPTIPRVYERFEARDIVKVPFPYTNRPVQQRRPALVVACHRIEGLPVLLWVLMVTSAAHRHWVGNVDTSDLTEAGLPAASLVRATKIATIKATDAELAGRLPRVDQAAVAHFLSATWHHERGA